MEYPGAIALVGSPRRSELGRVPRERPLGLVDVVSLVEPAG